jgi:Domain of unknown function (DUF4129)
MSSRQPPAAPQHGADSGAAADPQAAPGGQALRLIPVALLIVLALAGLRGTVAAPHWGGPLRGDGVAVGVALEAVLGTLLVITLRRGRDQRRSPGQTDDDVPGKLRTVLGYLLALGMIAVLVLLLVYVHVHLPAGTAPHTQPTVHAKLPTPPPAHKSPTSPAPVGVILYALLIVALAAAVALSIWLSRRLRRYAPVRFDVDAEEDSAGLRDAVESGRSALRTLDDARAAIIACYVAMERSLAERGTARAAADTPDELLARATATGIVRGTAASRLTALFYEARFSSHPLGREQRDAAARALDEIAAELHRAETAHAGKETGP